MARLSYADFLKEAETPAVRKPLKEDKQDDALTAGTETTSPQADEQQLIDEIAAGQQLADPVASIVENPPKIAPQPTDKIESNINFVSPRHQEVEPVSPPKPSDTPLPVPPISGLNPFGVSKKKAAKKEMKQQLVCFALGGEEYAVDIMNVQEIFEKKNVHPLPNQPPFVLGITHVRDDVVPVIDLASRMGLDIPGSKDYPFLMIVRVKNETVGLTVETVTEVRTFYRDELEVAPSLPRSGDSDFFDGIYIVDGHLLIVLQVSRILSSSEISDITLAINAVRSSLKEQ